MERQRTWHSVHGHHGKSEWATPELAAQCDVPNRKDQGNQTSSSEWLDSPDVLREKVALVVSLMRRSRRTMAYTGAGLSRSSGIPDYGTHAKNSVSTAAAPKKLRSNLDAEPTFSHHALVAMHRAGLLHAWVQQNHDGLPQKAGFPQEAINEIHGAWFDPSNPVVQFHESLRTDLFASMLEEEKACDLCLTLGTSLSGMNADRCADTPARKMLKGKALGTVIINLQQTPLDEICGVRIWARLDDTMSLLAEQLGLSPVPLDLAAKAPVGDRYRVPYAADGSRLPAASSGEEMMMWWDLRHDTPIKIAPKSSKFAGHEGRILGKTQNGDYRVCIAGPKTGWQTYVCLMGRWWVEAALRGAVPVLPFVNSVPELVTPAIVVPAFPPSVRVVQGHHTESGDREWHKWTLSVSPESETFVKEVSFLLHPTFTPAVVVCTHPPLRPLPRRVGRVQRQSHHHPY